MPTCAIECHAEALWRMQYAGKQVAGILLLEYLGTLLDPLFGTGKKGSGASPVIIWLALVVILLNSLDCLAKEYQKFGLEFHDRWDDIFEEEQANYGKIPFIFLANVWIL
jgi:hypothetical protein